MEEHIHYTVFRLASTTIAVVTQVKWREYTFALHPLLAPEPYRPSEWLELKDLGEAHFTISFSGNILSNEVWQSFKREFKSDIADATYPIPPEHLLIQRLQRKISLETESLAKVKNLAP